MWVFRLTRSLRTAGGCVKAASLQDIEIIMFYEFQGSSDFRNLQAAGGASRRQRLSGAYQLAA
jgi:hypothetical protein